MNQLPEYLANLNKQQMEAAKYVAGPSLILAGAGTGKTTVVVSKITYLIDHGIVAPDNILAVTFTNKAANEMNQRISNHLYYKLPWVGTFHSIALKILRTYHEEAGLNQNFVVIDTSDQLKIIQNILEDRNLSKNDFCPKATLNIIQNWKDSGLAPDDVDNSDLQSSLHEFAKSIYSSYQNQLQKMDAVDFGDIILKNVKLFQNYQFILSEYQRQFRFIFVDEYQDTNTVQYIWLRMLSQSDNVVCCVGDDDQSIYGWRGAKIGNILRFEDDFSNAKIFKLEQNYRSNHSILEVASNLIAHNATRYKKHLWTDSTTHNNKVILKLTWNDLEESSFIAHKITETSLKEETPLSEIAILVRASFQTRVIEEALIANAISYKIIGGQKFYDRMEIKDIIAFLKLSARPNDDISILRVINKPKRGIGKTTITKIRNIANEQNISFFEATKQLIAAKGFSKKIDESLCEFIKLIDDWNKISSDLSPNEILDEVIRSTKYVDCLKMEKTLEAQTRIENINEFKSALSEYENLDDFFEHITLVSDTDDLSSDNLVNVMTLHAAKGLEFDTVFLPGWEEGLFPHQKSIEEKGNLGLEEERRLAYVGITRAKNKLFISCASSRRMFNQFINSLPSRFIAELPEQHIMKIGFNRHQYNDSYIPTPQNNNITKKTESLPTKVFHQKFGKGVVIRKDGELLEVCFDSVGIKKIMRQFLKEI